MLPVLGIPAATPLIVKQRRAELRIGLLPAPAEQLDLHQIDWVDIRVPDIDRPTKHGIRLDQSGVAGHIEHRPNRPGQPIPQPLARWLQIRRHEPSVVFGGNPGISLGQHHLDQIDGRSERRLLAVHRAHEVALAPGLGPCERFLHPEPDAEQQPGLSPRKLPRDGAQAFDARPGRPPRRATPDVERAKVFLWRRRAEVLHEPGGSSYTVAR